MFHHVCIQLWILWLTPIFFNLFLLPTFVRDVIAPDLSSLLLYFENLVSFFSSCDDDYGSVERRSFAASDICCRLVDYNSFYFTIFYSSVSNPALGPSYTSAPFLDYIFVIFLLETVCWAQFYRFWCLLSDGTAPQTTNLVQWMLYRNVLFLLFWFLKDLLYSRCFYIHSCLCNLNA